MSAGELFYGPHPSGVGLVARAPETASQGAASAGRVIGANAAGGLDESWLPFGGAGTLADDEIDAGVMPVQTVDGGGRVWRWFGLRRMADWLEARIMDAVCPVGTVRAAVRGTNQNRWLRLDGRTIGDATSNADVAGDEMGALFRVLWSGFGVPYNLRLLNRDGLEVARGASAEADWAAGRRLALPDPSGRVLLAAGGGDGLTTRPCGMTGGAESVVIGNDYLTQHRHTVLTARSTGGQLVELVTGGRVTAGVASRATSTAIAEAITSIAAAAVSNHSHTAVVTVGDADSGSHFHSLTTDLAGGNDHTHEAAGAFETDAQKTVTVTVEPALADAQEHDHQASFDTDPAKQVAVGVTVESANEPGHQHGGQTGQAAGQRHGHSAGVTIGTGGAGTHQHSAQTSVEVSVNTVVTSTPTVSLQLDKTTRTVGGVGEAMAETSQAGSGAPLPVMPPYMAFDLLIRY